MSDSEHDSNKEEEEPEIDMTGWITKEIVQSGLENFGKTCENRGYAYLSLNLSEKDLEVLRPDIEAFRHLSQINLSKNNLKDLASLASLPNVTYINASENAIDNLNFLNSDSQLHHLKKLDVSKNKLTKLTTVNCRALTSLNLKENEIETAEGFEGPYSLSVLELRQNKLKDLKGLSGMSNLEELYVGENEIASFNELSNLPKLRVLHLRKNAITSLGDSWPDLPALEKLNIRENQIENLGEVKKFEQLPDMTAINLAGNPVSDEAADGFKKEVLIILPYMTSVNKDAVTEEDIKEAEDEKEERRKEEEAKRLAEEEAAEEEAAREAAKEGGDEKEAAEEGGD